MLVNLDNESMGLVREHLAADAVLPQNATLIGDAAFAIERNRPDVVIVGYTKSVEASLELAHTVRKEHPNLVMVALADGPDSQQILQAMRAGFKEYVVLPQDAQRLRQVVHE